MTFCFPQKNRLTPWVALLSLFIAMMKPFFVNAAEKREAPVVSEAEASIDNLNIDIIDLTQSLAQTNGDERDALQLQLFQKNQQLRAQLATAIEKESIPHKKLVQLVKTQEKYTNDATAYLASKTKSVTEKLNAAKDEEKLSIINDYREIQHYLDVIFEASWQNLVWLERLGEQNKRAETKFKECMYEHNASRSTLHEERFTGLC